MDVLQVDILFPTSPDPVQQSNDQDQMSAFIYSRYC